MRKCGAKASHIKLPHSDVKNERYDCYQCCSCDRKFHEGCRPNVPPSLATICSQPVKPMHAAMGDQSYVRK